MKERRNEVGESVVGMDYEKAIKVKGGNECIMMQGR